MTTSFKIQNRAPYGSSSEGYFILENGKGETVRTFCWEDSRIIVVYRTDKRRIETVSSTKQLEDGGVEFEILGETTQAKLKKNPIEIGARGRLKWVPQIAAFAHGYNLQPEQTLEATRALGWSAGLQVGLAGLIVVAGFLSGSHGPKKIETAVTLLSQDAVQKILNEAQETKPVQQTEAVAPAKQISQQAAKNIVVAPSLKKLAKNAPVPTHSSSFKHSTHVAAKGLHGGGYKSAAPRGYGTNEEHMNEIGALGALNAPHVRGGNGGKGGLNLQAVGTEAGSGAGGKGYGGFGNNGGGGHGLGGLGTGRGMGLANSMYGKGLIAAPFGEGSAAPGSGGYGTRGKAGGGAQGAGYGSQTVVGSWKGTGPKGNGAAGSGVGNGDPNGEPFGSIDGDDDDAMVTGGLDQEQILQIIQRNIGQVRYCYEQGLQKEPRLSGRVTLRWQIGGSGHVTLANVKHTSLHSAQVENCIVGKLRGWSFPKPQGGVTVAVVYPFNLHRTVSMR